MKLSSEDSEFNLWPPIFEEENKNSHLTNLFELPIMSIETVQFL